MHIYFNIVQGCFIDTGALSWLTPLWANEVTLNDLVDSIVTKSQQIKALLLQWRQNERDGVSNHQPHDCLLNRLFRRKLKKTSKLRVTGLCEGNSPVTSELPAHRVSNIENLFIWWRHHDRIAPHPGTLSCCPNLPSWYTSQGLRSYFTLCCCSLCFVTD